MLRHSSGKSLQLYPTEQRHTKKDEDQCCCQEIPRAWRERNVWWGGRFDAALGTELRLLAHKGKNDQINSLPNYA